MSMSYLLKKKKKNDSKKTPDEERQTIFSTFTMKENPPGVQTGSVSLLLNEIDTKVLDSLQPFRYTLLRTSEQLK